MNPTGSPLKPPPALLNWDVVHEKMPWNIILLLGGGFALARGSEVHLHYIYIQAFSRRSYPERLTVSTGIFPQRLVG